MEQQFSDACAQVRLYARKAIVHWPNTAKEKGIHGELEIGHSNMTTMEAIAEHLNMERMSDMKGGGTKFEGTAEHMTESNEHRWSMLQDGCEGEGSMKIRWADRPKAC